MMTRKTDSDWQSRYVATRKLSGYLLLRFAPKKPAIKDTSTKGE